MRTTVVPLKGPRVLYCLEVSQTYVLSHRRETEGPTRTLDSCRGPSGARRLTSSVQRLRTPGL